MASDLASFLSSDIVQLLAGGESRFLAHKDVLTSQSKPFRDALTGEWKESTERKIDLKDWDGATVGRVVEFLYRGRYRYPDPAAVSPGTAPESGPGALKTNGSQGNFQTEVERLGRFDPAKYDYGDVLLSHAKVYHLAHYKEIYPLRALALQHLLVSLWRMDPIDPHTGSHNMVRIVELVRDVYDNTDHLENHEEPLRGLVSDYVARNFSSLQSLPKMADLLGEGGDLVMDITAKLARGPSASWLHVCADSASRAPSRYIARLFIMNGSSDNDLPHDHVRELNGTNASVSWGCSSDSRKWLYPGYTASANDACTSITVRIGALSHPTPDAVQISSDRHILQNNDPGVKEKIVEVALLRQDVHLPDVFGIPAKHGKYDGMTTDINQGRHGGFLYIIWKSVRVV